MPAAKYKGVLCSVDACANGAKVKGLCENHYKKLLRYGDPTVSKNKKSSVCSVEDCDRKSETSLSFCLLHYKRYIRHGSPLIVKKQANGSLGICEVDLCHKKAISYHDSKEGRIQVCPRHYRQLSKFGEITNTGSTKLDPNRIICDNEICQIFMTDTNGDFNGIITIVDFSDFDLVVGYKWYATKERFKNGAIYYKIYSDSGDYRISLSQRIMGVIPTGNIRKTQHIDHKNRNTLDNRRSNLRFCTATQNAANKVKMGKGTYKGVLKVSDNTFRCVVGKKYIGQYRTEKEAALMYNKIASEKYGEFALLNDVV